MDQNNDWYERYSSFPAQDNNQRTSKKAERHGVRISTLIVFTMVAVLLGGLLGGLYTRQYVGEQLAALQTQQSQAALEAIRRQTEA